MEHQWRPSLRRSDARSSTDPSDELRIDASGDPVNLVPRAQEETLIARELQRRKQIRLKPRRTFTSSLNKLTHSDKIVFTQLISLLENANFHEAPTIASCDDEIFRMDLLQFNDNLVMENAQDIADLGLHPGR